MFIELMILNVVVHGAVIFQLVPSMIVHEAERIKEQNRIEELEKQNQIEEN